MFLHDKLVHLWRDTNFDLLIFGRSYEISYVRFEPFKIFNSKFRPPITPPGGAELKNKECQHFIHRNEVLPSCVTVANWPHPLYMSTTLA